MVDRNWLKCSPLLLYKKLMRWVVDVPVRRFHFLLLEIEAY